MFLKRADGSPWRGGGNIIFYSMDSFNRGPDLITTIFSLAIIVIMITHTLSSLCCSTADWDDDANMADIISELCSLF